GQKLMRIPDLSHMQVNVRVHEAMVSRLRAEILRSTGMIQSLHVALLANPDQRLNLLTQLNWPEIRERIKDEMKERYQADEFEAIYKGQPASIRVDAYPNRMLKGHVKSVANVASQAEFFSSDVKVYQTIASIDETVENLKPGMSAEVTIYAEDTGEPVLIVPIQSVVGTISMGEQRKCFVVGRDGQLEEREIVLGLSNGKNVDVPAGL